MKEKLVTAIADMNEEEALRLVREMLEKGVDISGQTSDQLTDDMLDWAQTIQHIGKRYQALANDRLEGERWAVDIKARRDDLMTHFQRGQAVEQSMGGAVFQRLFQDVFLSLLQR